MAEDVTERPGILAAWPAWPIGLGLAGQALAVAAVHPFELTYFNVLAGGPIGGRHILSDSNLDWGQGLKGLARLQCAEPEFRNLTLYYFGDTDPACYGVEGTAHIVNAVDDQSQLPGHPDRDDPLPGGFCLTPVGAVGTARVFSKTGFDRTLPDDR